MSKLVRQLKIDDCGCSWCDQYVGCKGHTVRVEYTTSVDSGTVYIDGELKFGGGDNLLDAIANLIGDLWSDSPKYTVPLPTDSKDRSIE